MAHSEMDEDDVRDLEHEVRRLRALENDLRRERDQARARVDELERALHVRNVEAKSAAIRVAGLRARIERLKEIAGERDALAAEIEEWRRVGMAILRTHRSGDVVLLREDADAITALLPGEPS